MSLLFPLHFHYQVPSCMKAESREEEEEGRRKEGRKEGSEQGGENHSAMQTAAAVARARMEERTGQLRCRAVLCSV